MNIEEEKKEIQPQKDIINPEIIAGIKLDEIVKLVIEGLFIGMGIATKENLKEIMKEKKENKK